MSQKPSQSLAYGSDQYYWRPYNVGAIPQENGCYTGENCMIYGYNYHDFPDHFQSYQAYQNMLYNLVRGDNELEFIRKDQVLLNPTNLPPDKANRNMYATPELALNYAYPAQHLRRRYENNPNAFYHKTPAAPGYYNPKNDAGPQPTVKSLLQRPDSNLFLEKAFESSKQQLHGFIVEPRSEEAYRSLLEQQYQAVDGGYKW